MIRLLAIPVAFAALAVSAAPASAGLLSSPLGTSAKMHLDDISLGVVTDTASGTETERRVPKDRTSSLRWSHLKMSDIQLKRG